MSDSSQEGHENIVCACLWALQLCALRRSHICISREEREECQAFVAAGSAHQRDVIFAVIQCSTGSVG